jgi:hypothetical protein
VGEEFPRLNHQQGINIMDIQNIQNAQRLFAAVEAKSSSGKGKISAESNVPLPEAVSEAPLKTVADGSNMNKMYYPPLFPLGHTQGIYEVMSDSQSSDSVEPVKTDAKQSGGNTTVAETYATGQQVASDKDGVVKNSVPVVKDAMNPGSVLDLEA